MITELRIYVCRVGVLGMMLWSCVFLSAQPRLRAPEMALGVHGGVMFATVLFTPDVIGMKPLVNSFISGGNGGLVFRYNGHRFFGLQLEMNYMIRGWREKQNDSLAQVNYTRKLHYLEIPFMTHVNFGKKACRFFINIGPQIGYCFKDGWSGQKNIDRPAEVQYDELTHKFDWGIIGGVGLLLKTRILGDWQIEARCSYGFGCLYDNRLFNYFTASNPLTLSANAGWLFCFTQKRKENKNNKKQLN